jgi:hypothetical protein
VRLLLFLDPPDLKALPDLQEVEVEVEVEVDLHGLRFLRIRLWI